MSCVPVDGSDAGCIPAADGILWLFALAGGTLFLGIVSLVAGVGALQQGRWAAATRILAPVPVGIVAWKGLFAGALSPVLGFVLLLGTPILMAVMLAIEWIGRRRARSVQPPDRPFGPRPGT